MILSEPIIAIIVTISLWSLGIIVTIAISYGKNKQWQRGTDKRLIRMEKQLGLDDGEAIFVKHTELQSLLNNANNEHKRIDQRLDALEQRMDRRRTQ